MTAEKKILNLAGAIVEKQKAWDDLDQLLEEIDASGIFNDLSDDWLEESRAGWDERLDRLYGF